MVNKEANLAEDILKENDLDDLVIAWYNEEINSLELLETEYDVANGTISASVEHFSIYMVVSISSYFYTIGRGNVESILKEGKADIVFVVDTTGSMSSEINNVRNNIEDFISKLKNNNVDARLGLVEYKDIYADGVDSTKNYNWYTNVLDFKEQLANLEISGGGDTPESLVDALECAEGMEFRLGVNRYIIVITDANYKNGTVSNRNATLIDEIDNLKSQEICVSVVTSKSYFTDYSSLINETDGVLVDINQNFSIGFLPIIMNIGVQTNSGPWARLTNGQAVKLDADPSLGDESIDTDDDGIPDLIELGEEHTIAVYNPATKKVESYKMWTFISNPVKDDTDGDGLSDLYDMKPCTFDITANVNDNSTIEFNTGRTWYYAGCTVYDYLDNSFSTTDHHVDNPISREELKKINERLGKNNEQNFSIEELTVIGLYDNEGSKFYMEEESKKVRETVFKNLTGNECRYFQHKGILWWSEWKEVPYGTSGGYFKGAVVTEADLNFTTGLFNQRDIYMAIDFALKFGAVIIAIIVILEVTPVVIANLQALSYYVKNFGIKQGLEMYKYLGVTNVPNGVMSWLQVDMADGDSSLDDVIDKGGSNVGNLSIGNCETRQARSQS